MSENFRDLQDRIRTFVGEREWGQFHDAKNLAMALSSEVGELVAELRWVASSDVADEVADPKRRERLIEELGDVTICLLMLADSLAVDPLNAATKKLEANAAKYPVATSRGRSDPATSD